MLSARDGVCIDHERTFLAFADMRVQFTCLAVGHPDRRGEVLAESGHPEGQDVDSGIGLAVKTQRTSNPACGVLSIPRTSPRADAFSQILHDLCGDAAVYVFSFGGVLHCLLLLQNKFFLRENPRRF